MRISAKEWILFILIAILCFGIWYKLSYPQFTFIDLSIDRKEALRRAESYLGARGVDTKKYLQAIVFTTDDWSDRYLQKTIGLTSEEKFMKQHNYEIFAWRIRFFKELQKEEYNIGISPKSGEVLSFSHAIEDIEPREAIEKDAAKLKAEEFLKKTYGLSLQDYKFHEENIKRYEKRIDYSFSWEKKGVYVPWRKEEGGAKLLIGATVSGNEVRGFYKNILDVPEKFRRYIENQLVFGEYLYTFSFAAFVMLLVWSIYLVVKRRHTLVVRLCKKWFLGLAIFFIIINLISVFNNIQNIIISYPTTAQLASFIIIYLIKLVISLIFLSVVFIFPGLAGESLHSEAIICNKYGSFLHYIKSTFFSRTLAKSILFGYLLFFIILGFQTTLFYIGQKYLVVWREWIKLTQLSSAYLPFLSAFIFGVYTSLNEEITFRLFGINWAKSCFKNTFWAVVFISLVWGLGHSGYAIFPVWFRGIEVTIIGLLLGFIFIKYGLIPVIIAHYLFNVFWDVAAYVLGHSATYLFVGSLAVFVMPLALAVAAYLINRKEEEKELKAMLDRVERYNLNILQTFVSMKKSQGISLKEIKEELLRHNWDNILIDLAVDEVFGEIK